ncbi:MAG: ABC transporter ATP-binding protein [Eubacteriales bacterium]|nr:ABC transporter ATP-binding protein [Eubacteriales bacterium]
MGEPRIRLQNISKYYYSEAAVTQALRKIDLSFAMNEFVAITGESGSGKSTLLRLISGMDSFDEGEMYINGEPTFQYDDEDWENYRREEIGFVFQDYSLIGHYSARDNIVSALLIMGMEQTEAARQADHYLERVGLQGNEEQLASELSSGQKQRLSIARALAKGTDIIVADEPTGNLDSETGEQIIRLLKELSRDHLVIMVTHNFEQAEPYVTRKIRLHDGDLVLDVQMNQGDTQEAGETYLAPHDNAVEAKENVSAKRDSDKKYIHRVASVLAGLNIRTQKGKAVMFTIFFLVTAMVSFLFIGELLMNADDRIAKTYDPSAFADEEKNRIVIRHQDGSPITEKDLKEIKQIRNVVTVDQYDNINDINFYYKKDRDYEIHFGYNDFDQERGSFTAIDDSHFMRSSTCISKEDLAAGRLPQKREEVVLYSKKGKEALDTEKVCYLTSENAWGSDEYIEWKIKVVGVLKEPTEQIYFSPALSQMLTAGMNCGNYTMHFYYDLFRGQLLAEDDFIPIIGEDLTGDQMRVSTYYSAPVDGQDMVPLDPEAAFHADAVGGANNYLEIIRYDVNGEPEEPVIRDNLNIKRDTHASTGRFLEFSEEAFAENNDMNSYQASVYCNSYAKTAKVIRALGKAGYDAISTYQVSVTKYDEEKVKERLIRIVIAWVVLVVLMIAEILILRSLMKIRIKDYFVLKFMGMKKKLMHRISYYEMGCYLTLAVVLAVLLMHIIRYGIPLIHEMLYYYELPGYLWFIAYNLVSWLLTVMSFNHLLEGRMDE